MAAVTTGCPSAGGSTDSGRGYRADPEHRKPTIWRFVDGSPIAGPWLGCQRQGSGMTFAPCVLTSQ